MANSQCRGYFSIPRSSISEVLGLGGDGKKTPRHTESDFSDTALKTSGSMNLKVQVFPLLWKGQLTAALGYRKRCLYLAHNSLSLHQPCSSLNQNISTVSMCLRHRILAAWRKHIRLVITCHLVWFLEWKLGKSTQPLAVSHSFRSAWALRPGSLLGWCQRCASPRPHSSLPLPSLYTSHPGFLSPYSA